jgi:hypothetical protein
MAVPVDLSDLLKAQIDKATVPQQIKWLKSVNSFLYNALPPLQTKEMVEDFVKWCVDRKSVINANVTLEYIDSFKGFGLKAHGTIKVG